MLLRTAFRHRHGRARPRLDLPLPRLPAAQRRGVRDPGPLPRGPGAHRGRRHAVRPHRRRGQQGPVPCLPDLQRHGLLPGRPGARRGVHSRRRLRRSGLPGAHRLELRGADASLDAAARRHHPLPLTPDPTPMRPLLLSLALAAALAGCGIAPAAADADTTTQSQAAEKAAQLDALYEGYWEEYLKLDPITATFQGDTRYNDQLPDAGSQAYRDEYKAFL